MNETIETVLKAKPAHKTDAEVITALGASGGIISRAADALGMCRQSVHRRISGSPTLQEALDETRQVNLDLAEGKLLEAIQKGESWAVCFFLKTQGKGRGYIEKQSIEMEANIRSQGRVCIYLPDNQRGDGPPPDEIADEQDDHPAMAGGVTLSLPDNNRDDNENEAESGGNTSPFASPNSET